MSRRKPDYIKYAGIIITLVTFISYCSISFYKVSEIEKNLITMRETTEEQKVFVAKQQEEQRVFAAKQQIVNDSILGFLADVKLGLKEMERRPR